MSTHRPIVTIRSLIPRVKEVCSRVSYVHVPSYISHCIVYYRCWRCVQGAWTLIYSSQSYGADTGVHVLLCASVAFFIPTSPILICDISFLVYTPIDLNF